MRGRYHFSDQADLAGWARHLLRTHFLNVGHGDCTIIEYRYVRNPIYLAVAAVVFGQAVLFGDWLLFAYGALFCLVCHLFVVG
jgi:Phospholipid methyltransferase